MTPDNQGLLNRIETEEIRAFCECPSQFQVLDFTGTALGTFFALDGIRRFKKEGEQPWAGISIVLGGFMIYVHSRRFVRGSELGTAFNQLQGERHGQIQR